MPILRCKASGVTKTVFSQTSLLLLCGLLTIFCFMAVLIVQLLDELAERFYNVKRRSGGLQGLLGDLFKVGIS
jgi:hypothetical protein